MHLKTSEDRKKMELDRNHSSKIKWRKYNSRSVREPPRKKKRRLNNKNVEALHFENAPKIGASWKILKTKFNDELLHHGLTGPYFEYFFCDMQMLLRMLKQDNK